jgi:uncharacterized glyoxalase superfamily protein PhnB
VAEAQETARPAVVGSLSYRDPIAAMRWLESAFGFEPSMLVTDKEGRVAFAEMTYRGAPFGFMQEWESPALIGEARIRSPLSVEGVNTGFFRVEVEDARTHCDRARAAGARIVQDPADQHYGARTYRALDLEGHVWNFSQPIDAPNAEVIGEKMGLKIERSG